MVQYQAEKAAEKHNQFAKNQRVLYKQTNGPVVDKQYSDAVIVGVHHDDGPDNPYYVSFFGREVFYCV